MFRFRRILTHLTSVSALVLAVAVPLPASAQGAEPQPKAVMETYSRIAQAMYEDALAAARAIGPQSSTGIAESCGR
jgi:uncharacterized iron-regulated protein